MINKDLVIQVLQEELRLQIKLNAGQKIIISKQEIIIEQKDIIIGNQNVIIEKQNIIDEKKDDVIKLLESRVKELENNQKKDSTNSSRPPSTDIAKPHRTKSLRIKSGKKPGGQEGHTGATLSMSATPDNIEIHSVKECCHCGKDLSANSFVGYERRQVYDIPPIKMFVTEHKGEIKHCHHCNAVTRATFPEAVNQPVQYGDNVRQLAIYLNQYQLLPLGRTAEIFEDLFGHHLSASFLVNNNHRCAENLQLFITGLKAMLRTEPVIHVDETGFYFEGKRNWLHTISTELLSYYAAHAKRGTEAMIDMDVLPLYRGTLVHDFWKSYLEFPCDHSLCNTHHCRDLTFCHEAEQSIWAGQVKELLLNVYAKVEIAKEMDSNATSLSKGQLYYWNKKYDDLIDDGLSMHPLPQKQKGKRGVVKKSKTQNLLERFINYKDEILAFARDFKIPFSNNIAEQAIRMMKLKQKISGCFRSAQGAKDFADIRSYIATAKKQGVPIMEALGRAIQGTPLTVMG